MRTLDIEYKHFLFFRKRKQIQVPEKWSDLTARQFSACTAIYLNPISDIDFCSRFFGIRKSIVKKLNKFELYKLTELTDFAVNPNGTVNFFFISSIPGTALISPRARLSNISIEHFAIFDTYFFEYVNKKTDEALDRFIAALYLKNKELVVNVDMNRRINGISMRIDRATKYAIFLNYIFLRRWLSKTYRFVFSVDEENEPSTKAKKQLSKSLDNLPDWNSMIDGLVGDDIIHYDEYKAVNCLVAFKMINNRIKKYHKNGKPAR